MRFTVVLGSEYFYHDPLGYDTLSSVKCLMTFQSNLLSAADFILNIKEAGTS